MNKKLKKEIRNFLKGFDVRVHFVRKGWSSAICSENLVEIDLRECPTDEKLWSLVFHELSHIVCYRKGLYKKYHHGTGCDKEYAAYIRKYGLRAERFVDKMGKKLMRKHFPNMEYQESYGTETEVEWYYKWVKRNYPL